MTSIFESVTISRFARWVLSQSTQCGKLRLHVKPLPGRAQKMRPSKYPSCHTYMRATEAEERTKLSLAYFNSTASVLYTLLLVFRSIAPKMCFTVEHRGKVGSCQEVASPDPAFARCRARLTGIGQKVNSGAAGSTPAPNPSTDNNIATTSKSHSIIFKRSAHSYRSTVTNPTTPRPLQPCA